MKTKVHLRVINGHYQLRCDQPLNLRQLQSVAFLHGRLHVCRPTMLSCRLLGRRVQFFPNGTIQVLAGGMTHALFHRLHVMIRQGLIRYNASQAVTRVVTTLSPWTVSNIVMYFNVFQDFIFTGIMCNSCVSYEPELFPALLLAKWPTARVTMFSNGKGIITGVRHPCQAIAVLRDVMCDLKHRKRRNDFY